MKFKIFFLEILAVANQILLPFLINWAENERGYKAVGGEYAVVVLSVIVTVYTFGAIKDCCENVKKC